MRLKFPGALAKATALLGAGLLVFVAMSVFNGSSKTAEAASLPGQVRLSPAADTCYYPTANIFTFGYFYGAPVTCISNCTGFVPAFLSAVCSSPPAQIVPTSTTSTSTCGSNENLSFKVLNTYGISVLDGTTVRFTTTLGLITPSTTTSGGNATASLMIPPKQAGIATVAVTAGGVSFQENITVTCATAPASSVQFAPVPQAPIAPAQITTVPTTPVYGYPY